MLASAILADQERAKIIINEWDALIAYQNYIAPQLNPFATRNIHSCLAIMSPNATAATTVGRPDRSRAGACAPRLLIRKRAISSHLP